MTDRDKLIALLEDGRRIAAIGGEADLRALFENSSTDIGAAFDGGAEGLLQQWPEDDRLDQVRAYLLWDYIAYNVADLFGKYDLARQMLEEQLQD